VNDATWILDIHIQARAEIMNEYEMEMNIYRRLLRYPVMVAQQISLGCNKRIVDLAYLACGDLVTIELKIKDWRHALEQAADHLDVADYAYVVMPPYKRITRPMELSFTQSGIGLCFYRPPKKTIEIKGRYLRLRYADDDSFPLQLIFPASRNEKVCEYSRPDFEMHVFYNYIREYKTAINNIVGFGMVEDMWKFEKDCKKDGE